MEFAEGCMNARKRWRLSAMMALVYAVQGSFWPLLAVHLSDLGIAGRDRGWIFATLAIGSMAVPLGAGQLVDRLMATQRVLALVYALGTVLLAALASGRVRSSGGLFALFLAYWALTAPAYSLSNALAMRNLEDPGKEFGGVRLWGTAGWMVSGWLVSLVMAASGSTRAGQGAYESLWVAAAVSAATAAYCLTLPHTPPLAIGRGGAGAVRTGLALGRQPDIVVFLVTSFGVYLTQPLVFQVMPGYLEVSGLPRAWVSMAMTLGQTTEIAMLAALPWLLRRFGLKATMMLGISAWFVRFLSLSLGPPLWLAVAGTLVHGIGIACFTVGGQVYMDGRAPRALRASAQALLLVATSGVGSFLGNVLAGEIVGRTHHGDVLVFLIPCLIDGALLLYFLRGFRAPALVAARAGAANDERSSLSATGRGPVARVGQLVTESADG
jgi:MFS family permease